MTDDGAGERVDPAPFALDDRYRRMSGRVHLTGIQALARLPIDQARADQVAGREQGMFCTHG